MTSRQVDIDCRSRLARLCHFTSLNMIVVESYCRCEQPSIRTLQQLYLHTSPALNILTVFCKVGYFRISRSALRHTGGEYVILDGRIGQAVGFLAGKKAFIIAGHHDHIGRYQP